MLSKDTELRLDHAVTDDKIGDEISARLISETPADDVEAQAVLALLDETRNAAIEERLTTALAGDAQGAAGKELAKKINAMVDVLKARAVPNVAEAETIDVVADVGGNLNGTGFLIRDIDRTYGLVFSATSSEEDESYQYIGSGGGADLDIDGPAAYFQSADDLFYAYFIVSDGAEAQTDPGQNGLAIPVTILSADTSATIHTKLYNAILAQLPNLPDIKSLIAFPTQVDVIYWPGVRTLGSAGNSLDVEHSQNDAGTNGTGTVPADITSEADVIIRMPGVGSGASASTVGTAVQNVINTLLAFNSAFVSPQLTITRTEEGAVEDTEDSAVSPTGFTFALTSDGIVIDLAPAKAAMGSEPMSESTRYALEHALGSKAAADEFKAAYDAMVAAVQAIS